MRDDHQERQLEAFLQFLSDVAWFANEALARHCRHRRPRNREYLSPSRERHRAFSVHAAVRAYFAPEAGHHQNTECGADLALRPEIVGAVVRDMSRAAVETALGQPGFFVSLVPVHRDGRWPCAWEGQYPEGRCVVL